MARPRASLYLTAMSSPFRIDDSAGADARRAAAVQRLRDETGIDEPMIDALVEAFYARVRDDRLIGPIFAARIDDWGPHLAQMKLFWSSVALSTGVYQGRPMPKHLPCPSTPATSTIGWRSSSRPPTTSARRLPPRTSSNAPVVSPKAWNSASPTPTTSCWPRANATPAPSKAGRRNRSGGTIFQSVEDASDDDVIAFHTIANDIAGLPKSDDHVATADPVLGRTLWKRPQSSQRPVQHIRSAQGGSWRHIGQKVRDANQIATRRRQQPNPIVHVFSASLRSRLA